MVPREATLSLCYWIKAKASQLFRKRTAFVQTREEGKETWHGKWLIPKSQTAEQCSHWKFPDFHPISHHRHPRICEAQNTDIPNSEEQRTENFCCVSVPIPNWILVHSSVLVQPPRSIHLNGSKRERFHLKIEDPPVTTFNRTFRISIQFRVEANFVWQVHPVQSSLDQAWRRGFVWDAEGNPRILFLLSNFQERWGSGPEICQF